MSISINFAEVRNAVAALEKALSEHPAPPQVAAEMEPEIQTMKAQLSKSEPSRSILREAGKTLRNIAEGAAGSLLAPKVVIAINSLATMLGLQ